MAEVKKQNVSKVILERLRALDDLPHFPDALMKLEQILVSDPNAHLDDVTGLVAQDPRLTAGLIGVVNSARYSPGYDISDLNEAVSRLGMTDVRTMAHAINYKSAIKTKPPFSEKDFMRHALIAAYAGQAIAAKVHINQGEAFLAGLMHDIGIYLLATENREKYNEVIQLARGDVRRIVPAEQKIFKTTHTVVGARLMQQWRFPMDVVMGVATHHRPEEAEPQYQAYAYLTHLAEQASYLVGWSNAIVNYQEEDLLETTHIALEYFGLAVSTYKDICEDAMTLAENTAIG